MTSRVSSVVMSIMVVVVTFRSARAADALVLRVVRPPRGEVLLVSDVILATAFGVVVYLWLHLRATRTRLTGLERAQLVLDTQLSLAAQIQRHLLPPIPVRSNGVRWAGRLEPAYSIGGDFYDFIPAVATPPPLATAVSGSLSQAVSADGLFVVGDVSGKGIPAALLQASAHSLFRTLARETVHPADLLTRISREIYAENAGALYLTCILIRVDSASRTLIYTNAGHPTGLMMGSAGRRLLSRGGPPVGLFPETAYESEVVSVNPGDLGVIVSDGITEAVEEEGTPPVDVLNRAISGIPEPRTPQRVCDVLIELAQRHSGPRGVAYWEDDKTVLAFMFDGREAAVDAPPFVAQV
jgi:serine phosphatase RsbU (regulator of sigma subunit)